MRRFAKRRRWLSIVLLGALADAGGCGSDLPAPQKVTQERRGKEPPNPDKPTPFSNPDEDPPGPRAGKLPEPEAVNKMLANARKQMDAGRVMAGVAILRRCANKIPPSVACEAAIGMALSTTGKHRAYARHYMAAAADIDDPAVGSDTYRELAKVAHKDAQFPTEVSALTIVAARGDATADDYSALAGALSADPQRRDEAATAYGKAYETDPTRYEDLRKRSVLLAQLGQRAEAIKGFEEYIEKAGDHSPHRMGVENRIAELKRELEKKK